MPVAANHGTAKIMKMNDMVAPPYLVWNYTPAPLAEYPLPTG
jgi:hypothetical protein